MIVAQPALAQQEDTFSEADAAAVLGGDDADPATNSDSPDAQDCPIRLPNGSCAREADERGFAFARSASSSSSSSNAASRNQRPSASSGSSARPAAAAARAAQTPITANRVVRELPIRFEVGSYELSERSKRNVETLATAMMEPANRSKSIMVAGHTDRSGSADLNYELSRKRAEAVASYMTSLGVEANRIETRGFGFDQLLPGVAATNPRNRRVEVQRVD